MKFFVWFGLVWFDWQELWSSHFSSHDLVSTCNPPIPTLFASSTVEGLVLLSQGCSPAIFWKVYIPWYTFGFFYKILFLILPTHFGFRLFDAPKKVGSEKITLLDKKKKKCLCLWLDSLSILDVVEKLFSYSHGIIYHGIRFGNPINTLRQWPRSFHY